VAQKSLYKGTMKRNELNPHNLKLTYRVEGQGKINAEVASVEAAQSFLRDHQLGKIQPFPEGFGASELLSTPTVTDSDGRVIARLNYNSTIHTCDDLCKH
jgi:hypothetical protein